MPVKVMFLYMYVRVVTNSIYTRQFFKVLILYFMVIMYLNYTQIINTKPERVLKNPILSTLRGKNDNFMSKKWEFIYQVFPVQFHQLG